MKKFLLLIIVLGTGFSLYSSLKPSEPQKETSLPSPDQRQSTTEKTPNTTTDKNNIKIANAPMDDLKKEAQTPTSSHSLKSYIIHHRMMITLMGSFLFILIGLVYTYNFFNRI